MNSLACSSPLDLYFYDFTISSLRYCRVSAFIFEFLTKGSLVASAVTVLNTYILYADILISTVSGNNLVSSNSTLSTAIMYISSVTAIIVIVIVNIIDNR